MRAQQNEQGMRHAASAGNCPENRNDRRDPIAAVIRRAE
jgi:hypothetical protein